MNNNDFVKNKNEPSSPVETSKRSFYGLTKREYMAAMAMQGLLSNDFDGTHEIFTAHAVKIADALLKALETDQQT